jgi:GNAT superfamily N-acetyltransferase
VNATLDLEVVTTQPEHFGGIQELTRSVYPNAPPWNPIQLRSHHDVFPEGQFVAIDRGSGRIVGMAASLIVLWDDYEIGTNWREFTDRGMFTNHDPEHGRTLYGAEIMVEPTLQGHGIGSRLYDRRRTLTEALGLLRIRAGARLRGYGRHATLTPEEYVQRVIAGEIRDPTLSFQLHRGFTVLAVVEGYLQHDAESLGYAAVIEWLNPKVEPAQA